ncbi:MAG: hypothetical protein H6754_08705 [Candidatus Omnitrophica bacterium]|nr:hypothetical protein [Candidatus Omnitrophota bacterium]
MNFHLTKGFIIQGIRIAEKEGGATPFLSIDKITFSVPLPDLLRTGHMLIPSATIHKPIVHIKNLQDNQWNFSDLLTQKTAPTSDTKSKKASQPRITLGGIHIEQGTIEITNQNLIETITDLNITVRLSLNKSVNFDADFKVPTNATTFATNGKFLTTPKDLSATIVTKNLNPPRFLTLSRIPLYIDIQEWIINDANLNLKFKDAQLTLSGSIAGPFHAKTNTDINVKLKSDIKSDQFLFRKKGRNFTLEGAFIAPSTTLTIDDNKVFIGNFSGNNIRFERSNDQFNMTGNLLGQGAKMSFAGQQLNGDAQLERIIFKKQGLLLNLSSQGKITNASYKGPFWNLISSSTKATFQFSRDQGGLNLQIATLSTKDLSGMIANKKISSQSTGQNIKITSTNKSFQAQGQLKTESLSIVTSQFGTFTGDPEINFNITRNPDLNNNKLWYSGTTVLYESSLKNIPRFGNITNLKGKVSLNTTDAANLLWENLEFNFLSQNYKATGFLKNFNEPNINTTLTGKNFNINLKGAIDDNIITLSSLTGTYHHTSFDVKGNIGVRGGFPNVDLTGAVHLNLLDLALIPSLQKNFKTISPAGIITLEGHYIFPAMSWQKMALSAKVTAKQFTLYGYNFENLSGNLAELNDNRQSIKLNALLYEGKVSLDAKLALDQQDIPSEIILSLNDMDLQKLKDNTKSLMTKDFAGTLSANTTLAGPLLNYKNLQGNGAVAVIEGRLLEIEMFKGIWKVLFSNLLVDDYKKIAFNQAKASFKITNQRFITEDLILKSAPADISAKGWIGFDGVINFDVLAKVREAPIATSTAIKAVPTTIISQVAQNAVGIKLTGSLSDPKVKYKILPLKILEKTTGSILQGLSGMLEDVL